MNFVITGTGTASIRRIAAILAVSLSVTGPAFGQDAQSSGSLHTLMETLGQGQAEAQVTAAEALGNYGRSASGAVPQLAELVGGSNNDSVKIAAAVALERIAEEPDIAVPALLVALDDPSPVVRVAACLALGAFSSKKETVIPAIGSALQDSDSAVRDAAAVSLAKMGAHAIPALRARLADEDPGVRMLAAQTIGGIGAGARAGLPDLVAAIADRNVHVRKAVVTAMGRVGADKYWPAGLAWDDELAALVDDVRPLTASVRTHHSPLLHRLNLEKVLPPLVDSLNDPEPEIRFAAATALGRIGPPARSGLDLLRDTAGDIDPRQRRAAISALSQIAPEDEVTLSVLRDGVLDDDEHVRWSSARGLVRAGAAAVPALVNALADDRAHVRRVAADTLGQIGPAAVAAGDALRRVSQDSDKDVAEAAHHALALIAGG